MKIKYIEAKNFRSYRYFKLPLKNKGLILLSEKNGSGKAQPYSEKIMTTKGIKTIGELKVGDYVYNRFGKPEKVTNIFEKGKLEVYKVLLKDGRSILVNKDHLFTRFSERNNLVTLSLKQMIKHGITRPNPEHLGSVIYTYKLPLPKAIEYPAKKLVYDPYTVGALLGDGCMIDQHLQISASKNKLFILDKIVHNNDSLQSYRRNSLKNYTYAFILNKKNQRLYHNRLTFLARNSDLNLPQCICKPTHEKSIPLELMQGSIGQRLELLQGLFDTDGTCGKDYHRRNIPSVHFSSVNKELVKQIQQLLWSLGFKCSITSEDRRGKKHKSRKYIYKSIEYQLTINGSIRMLKSLFTRPDMLKRFEGCKTHRFKHTDRESIIDVKDLNYKENMRCIMVDDPEHLYVSGQYVVSHNSSVVYAMIYALYGETPDGAKGDEVIKKDVGKDCFTRVEFQHFNHDYVVTRYRKNKDYKNKVLVKRDGKDITLPSNRATNQKIEQILGFGFDTLLNSMIFSPERLNTFINSTDKQRKKILEELTNTNIYKQAQTLVKADRDTGCQKLSDVSKEIEHTNTLLESQKGLQRQYELNKRNHEQQLQSLQNQIKNLQAQVAKIKVDNSITVDALKASYNDCSRQIKSLQSQLGPNTDSQELVKINNQLTQDQSQQNQLKQQLMDLMKTAKQVMNSRLPTCKWCGSKLNAQHKQIELNNINTQAVKLGQQYNAMAKPIQELKQNQKALKAKVDSQSGLNKQLNSKITELGQKQQYYLLKLNQNSANQKSKEQLNSQIASLSTQYQVEQNKKIKAVQVDTKGLEDKLVQYNQEKDKLEQDQRDYKSLIQIYSDRGVKAQALSVVLPFLNQELAKILKVLTDNRLTASLEAHTKTKSGKVNNQISLLINSAVSGPNYQDLSSGEKRRIGIALNIAFMQYLKSQIGGLNLAVFDEVFDNLDQAGIDKVIDVLAKLKSEIPNILIMSHNDDLIYNDNIDARIKIKKTNGTSEIIK